MPQIQAIRRTHGFPGDSQKARVSKYKAEATTLAPRPANCSVSFDVLPGTYFGAPHSQEHIVLGSSLSRRGGGARICNGRAKPEKTLGNVTWSLNVVLQVAKEWRSLASQARFHVFLAQLAGVIRSAQSIIFMNLRGARLNSP